MMPHRRLIPTLDELARHGEEILDMQGLDGLTARSLARKASISVGTIYNISVTGMDAVIEQMNARLLLRLSQVLAAQIEPEACFRVTLNRMLSSYLRFVERERNGWNLLLSHRLPEGVAESRAFAEARETAIAQLLAVIRPFMEDDEKARLNVISLWASLHGVVSLSMQRKLAGGFCLEVVAQNVLDAFLNGMEKRR
jgi:AcrR family transcriptional regulator